MAIDALNDNASGKLSDKATIEVMWLCLVEQAPPNAKTIAHAKKLAKTMIIEDIKKALKAKNFKRAEELFFKVFGNFPAGQERTEVCRMWDGLTEKERIVCQRSIV